MKEKATTEDIRIASEEYGCYIKIVIDIKSGLTVIGGEWHADGEKILLENGSRQEDIWGGGIDLESKKIETVALINLRPSQNNDSQEILDEGIRDRFMTLAKERFNL